MQSHRNSVLSRSMAVVPGATISIYDAGTSNLSTIYSDNGVTAASNPLTSDADGEFEFWAADGRYDVTTTYSGQTDSYEIILFDPIGGGSTTDISIGPTATPTLFLDVSANDLQVGKNLSTEAASIQLGNGRTGNGNSFIDLVADATYTGYGTRLIRGNSGANSYSILFHRGTGRLQLYCEDAGSVEILTNSTSALTVDSSRNLKLGTSATMGTSAVGALGIAIGTAPTTSPANMIQMYAKDSSDGTTNATLAFRTEQAVEAIGTFTASHKLKVWINGVEYWVQLDAV